jgi:hypothetical protein
VNENLPSPVPGAAAVPDAIEARLAHLFRAARHDGRIHPLQHLIQRYRTETPPPPCSEGPP